jgi:Uma2 family endonuclease
MSAVLQKRMTVDEFLAWAEGQPGRYELFRGIVYAMTPERAIHAEVKFALQTALANGLKLEPPGIELILADIYRAPDA